MKAAPTPGPRCGTRAGHKRHTRLGEQQCDRCRASHTARNRASRARCKARLAPVYVPIGGCWQAADRKALIRALAEARAL